MKTRLFYDLESDSEHPQYCNMSLFGILEEATLASGKIEDKVYVWSAPFDQDKLDAIKAVLCRDNVERISFNNLNYDDLVLHNYGITIPEDGTHDAMLAIKTCYPGLPSHALKYLCWFLLGDPHWEQFRMNQKGHRFDGTITQELRDYHKHDLNQHRQIWDWVLPKLTDPDLPHWDAYQIDMGMKFPLQEMIFDGGVNVDVEKCSTTLSRLIQRKKEIQEEIYNITNGQIKNANSNKQVGKYLDGFEGFILDLTATGEFQIKKKDLTELAGIDEEDMRKWRPGDAVTGGISPVGMLAWQMKDLETLRKYVANYLKAAQGTNMNGWIPSAYAVSRAGTRRTLSKSFYKINFQNSTEAIEEFKLVPPGYLGWFIDSTQVENVVHIYESGDIARRAAYEADENWNEYVWVANRVLGTNKSKKELDSIKSTQIPHWSVYKLYKTVKLALNFGQGARAFCKLLDLSEKIGKAAFADVHRACPAIRQLQDKVERQLSSRGFVQDTFGHIYSGPVDEAYKIVAYLIQGCGTGSLPKAQIRANYDTIHSWSENLGTNVGPLVSTTHDENGGFLRLDLGEEVLTCILQELYDNMTKRFSSKFDGIPLRAKLYLTRTNIKDKKYGEVIGMDPEMLRSYCKPNWKPNFGK